MAATQAAATTQPPAGTLLPLPTAAAAVADPRLSQPQTSVLVTASEPAGQAAFNPFATIGTVVQQHGPPTAPPQAGDWLLPVLVMAVGALIVGRLLRRMAQ